MSISVMPLLYICLIWFSSLSLSISRYRSMGRMGF